MRGASSSPMPACAGLDDPVGMSLRPTRTFTARSWRSSWSSASTNTRSIIARIGSPAQVVPNGRLRSIGFEGRDDYGALGTVTNVAARLSDEAAAGQILLSQRAYAALEGRVDARAPAEGPRPPHGGLRARRPVELSQRHATAASSTGSANPFSVSERGSESRKRPAPSRLAVLTRISPPPASAPMRAAMWTPWPA